MDEAEGYSATVRAELHIGGLVLDLAEIGPEHCVLRTPMLVPAGRGTIIISVDGEVQETEVHVLGDTNCVEETLTIRQFG